MVADEVSPRLVSGSFDLLTKNNSKILVVTLELGLQLQWWTKVPNLIMGSPFKHLRPKIQVTTNVKSHRLRCSLSGFQVYALWFKKQRNMHINKQELLAVIRAFEAFETITLGK